MELVEEEIARLLALWRKPEERSAEAIVEEVLGAERAAGLDRFERAQLTEVLKVARECATISEAGRRLFAVSRLEKSRPNDADRLSKYLARFGLKWDDLRRG